MKKTLFTMLLTLYLSFIYTEPQTSIESYYSEAIDIPEAAIFVPPTDWLAVDPSQLPPSVKAMVVGKSEKEYPPTINIGTESYAGSLKSYLKNIKMINESQNASWKDLGQIATKSGNASLSQVDMNTEWGEVRLMHAIILRYGTAYILTCGCLKEEFASFYKDFFGAIKSLKVNKDVYELVKNPEKRAKLQTLVQSVKKEWLQTLGEVKTQEASLELSDLQKLAFDSDQFQEKAWAPFLTKIDQDFADQGEAWKDFMIEKLRFELGF